jgi:5-methylcytosine-specific restriction protein B
MTIPETFEMEKLLDLIYNHATDWEKANREAFDSLFGQGGRYPSRAASVVKLRAPKFSAGGGVSFAAYIHPSNPDSGAYGGTSIVIFPVDEGSCLISLVVGTQGIAPDEDILGRPGHGRKLQAICGWLNQEFGHGRQLAWAKADPVRIDMEIPRQLREQFAAYQAVFERYGKVIYGLYVPNADRNATRHALTAFLDLLFEERGYFPLAAHKQESERIRAGYFSHLMPAVTPSAVETTLADLRYVILEGPPGTGKTRLAEELLKTTYAGNGMTIQFHPNTTYENFVGGLAPLAADDGFGFRFGPRRGALMEAAVAAASDPTRPYLLHIDEINRADLSKILGEAIYLLEAKAEHQRQVTLAYDFGAPIHQQLTLPPNLHILGTMNSSDRSIAIMDIAIRRRFAFMKLWPQMTVVEQKGTTLMQEAFRALMSIFVEHASDEALRLMPGHSYFIKTGPDNDVRALKTGLTPLLEEYLEQGYVVGFAEQLRAYLQWIDSL